MVWFGVVLTSCLFAFMRIVPMNTATVMLFAAVMLGISLWSPFFSIIFVWIFFVEWVGHGPIRS